MDTQQQNSQKASQEECQFPIKPDHSNISNNLLYNECSICLDSAQEPVVTLCGHLYCWPCIYLWLTHSNCSQKQCPVCKKPLSQTMLVPLYGRGDGLTQESKLQNPDIPKRPSAYMVQTLLSTEYVHNQHREQQFLYGHGLHYSNGNEGAYMVISWPMAGIFGEVAISVLSWVSGYPQGRLNSMGILNSNRGVRLEEQTERSLSRISAFLFWCFLFCLLMF